MIYIAYFDYLGYKEFLLRNPKEILRTRANHILRDIEFSLSDDKRVVIKPGRSIANFDKFKVNCINISDTVLFWTNDDSPESLKELLKVCYKFNSKQIFNTMPIRGCIIYDDFDFISGHQENKNGIIYSPNMLFGKGLYNAHEKTESLNWAGTVVDISVIESIPNNKFSVSLKQDYLLKYKIPYKGFYRKEYALRLINVIDESSKKDVKGIKTYQKNLSEQIINTFESDNKSVSPSVIEKLNNTIDYLNYHFDEIKK